MSVTMVVIMIMVAAVIMFVVVVMVMGVIVIVIVMILPVAMAMSMIMCRMPMIMRTPARGMIGSPRRLEGLVDLQHRGPQSLQHGADDMIAQDDDAVFFNLGGKMTVAKMPGKLDEMHAIASANFEELLVGRKNLDQFAVLAHQQVAIGEKHRILEIEHDHLAVFQMQELAAKMAQIMRQLDLGGRMGRRSAGGKI
jgi:hypothetical protein